MFRWTLRIAIASVILVAAWLAYHRSQRNQLLDTLNQALGVPEKSNRKALALDLAQSSLATLANPNVYVFLSPTLVSTFDSRFSELATSLPSIGPFKKFMLKAKSIGLEDATIAVTVGFQGELSQVPVTIQGAVTILAAPSFNGTDLELFPVDARIVVDQVSVGGHADGKLLPVLINAATRPVVDYVSSRVGAVSLPVGLGISKDLDLARSLRDIPEVRNVENGTTHVYLVFNSSTVLATKDGIHLVGFARLISQRELDIAFQQLKEMSKLASQIPPLATCPPCQFAWSQRDKYLVCLREYLDCNTDKRIGARKDSLRLSPVQGLALRLLANKTDAESRDVVGPLKYFLTPSIKMDAISPNTESISERVGKIRDSVLRLRRLVEPDDAFVQKDSVLAIRKDFLSSSINRIASSIAPRADLLIDRRQENFNQTISSPPTPDLKCDQNMRGCPSDFDADYGSGHPYNPRGCNSNCSVMHCDSGDVSHFLNRGHDICVEIPKPGCIAAKLDCERLKEQERLEYEASKAAAKAAWMLNKLDCERLKETAKVGCNINQEWLRMVGDKELGRVEGNAVISAANAKVEFHSFQVSPNLDQVSLTALVAGSANVETSFIFNPLNAGYVACVAQWGGTVRASVTLPPKEITLRAMIDQASTPGDTLVYKLDEVQEDIKMSPAPGLALLSQNPHMALVCPAVGALTSASPVTVGIALALADSLPIKIPARRIQLPLIGNSTGSQLGGARPHVYMGVQSVLAQLSN